MMKFSKFFEFAYLAAAAFFLYEAVIIWNEQRTQAYLFLFFVAVGIFMFFFRRHFRHKYGNRNK
ncbi:MAG: hypothetical protein R3209_10135 [Salinimicrobium sediminis]|uniref:Uncharacterized protein n=1 Tax=Salinimicrobium sediminis TaxID=1343891 RepID=A0A285X5C0_9FLAO|nr:hypothetical protein [Salinimicrobium sediminis]MDX1603422.1 hypothetical protein [Salinimicrobium sediminis]SOC79974.1 hypothetical protein SAMN06296241_1516 [Salinimicrobium sediminis]